MSSGRVSESAASAALTPRTFLVNGERPALPRCVLAAIGFAVVGFAVAGCSSRLPGPIDCERMATRLIGEEAERIRASPAKKRLLTIVVHGCLTTPFDHQAVRCVEETRGLPRCMEDLAWRIPERKPSITRFMTRALSP